MLTQINLDVSNNILLGIFPDEDSSRAAHRSWHPLGKREPLAWHQENDDDPDAEPWGELVLIPVEIGKILALDIENDLVSPAR